jgi:hypothetical protein
MTVKVNFGTGFKLFVKLVARAFVHALSNHVSCSCALFLYSTTITSTFDLGFSNKARAYKMKVAEMLSDLTSLQVCVS